MLTSSAHEEGEMAVKTEPVDIEGNAEQQCLYLLGGGRAPGSLKLPQFGRQFLVRRRPMFG
jgi:hypothetical protein